MFPAHLATFKSSMTTKSLKLTANKINYKQSLTIKVFSSFNLFKSVLFTTFRTRILLNFLIKRLDARVFSNANLILQMKLLFNYLQ